MNNDFPGFHPELKLYCIIFFWIQPRIKIMYIMDFPGFHPELKLCHIIFSWFHPELKLL